VTKRRLCKTRINRWRAAESASSRLVRRAGAAEFGR
jgi:hypothetical protein